MGKSNIEIAVKLSRDKSTISREVNRNTGGRGYRPNQANKMANERSKTAMKACRKTPYVIDKIEEKRLLCKVSG